MSFRKDFRIIFLREKVEFKKKLSKKAWASRAGLRGYPGLAPGQVRQGKAVM
jgi:hypothetical protein